MLYLKRGVTVESCHGVGSQNGAICEACIKHVRSNCVASGRRHNLISTRKADIPTKKRFALGARRK